MIERPQTGKGLVHRDNINSNNPLTVSGALENRVKLEHVDEWHAMEK